jgi:kinesin family protein 5
MSGESIKVAVRFRGNEGDALKANWNFDSENSVRAVNDKVLSYDIVLDPLVDQKVMYELCAKDMIIQYTLGFNCTIFAYGQSGSGKTFSMLGPDDVVDAIKEGSANVPDKVQELYGIIPRAVFDIFTWINTEMTKDKQTEFEIKVYYFEIYNESLNNLLTMPPQKNMKMRELKSGMTTVLNCEPNYATCPEDIFELLKLGQENRAVAGTNQNARSSRSHTIFILDIEQKNGDGSVKQARLNLVDLAGSERIDKTGATGQTLKEAMKIKSLTDGASHVPFRDSKLTMFLKQSLGGNSKTLLICTASALERHYEEAYQTCRFASRAKKVQNKATTNVMKSRDELEVMINRLKSECNALKKQLVDNNIKPNVKAYKGHAVEEKKKGDAEEEKKGDTEEGKFGNLQILMNFV